MPGVSGDSCILEAGAQVLFTVSVELIKLPITEDVSTTIDVEIIASPTYNS